MSSRFSRAIIVLLCFIFCAALAPAAFAESEATPVTLIFSCEDDSALPGLQVFDDTGAEYAPMKDAATGEIQYGCFLLLPGDYSYYFHDEAGRYEDFGDSITISQAIKHYIPIDLTPVVGFESFSFTYIEPIYEGIITDADIPAVAPEQIAAAEDALRELATVQTNNPKRLRAIQYWNENIYYDNDEEAALFLRSQIEAFQDTVMLGICSDVKLTNSSGSQKIMNIWYTAIAHTGVPTEGDYLRYEYGGFKVNIEKIDDTYIGTEDGLYYYQVPFSLLHFTNADQEAELTPIVDSILIQLDLDGKSDYQKIYAIYDYICTNVTYDYDSSGNLKRTAYAALVNHSAVCQGYSAAFYRLCLASDVDTRMITSKSLGHAWNIAALNGLYYELDTTWDAGYSPEKYRYLLIGSIGWPATPHNELGDEFTKSDFAAAYPLSPYNRYIKIRFETNGAEAIEGLTMSGGETLAQPDAPAKDGYWFGGWYSDSSFASFYDFTAPLAVDLTLYARWASPDLILPAAITEIGEEAFRGDGFTFVKLPEAAVSIGPYAFADCPKLAFIYIPAETEAIDETAFDSVQGLMIYGKAPSAAKTYAEKHGYLFSAVS